MFKWMEVVKATHLNFISHDLVRRPCAKSHLGKKHEKVYPFSRNNGFVGKTLNETRLVLKGPFSTEP